VVALERHFPEATARGLVGLDALPTIHVSAEAHHSFVKAARIAGLGHAAVREIPLCAELGVDLHVDAAWAGAIGLSPRRRVLLEGIERADSVTVDAHKWLSAPMAAGVFLTRHGGDLTRAFRVAADYMPSAEASDPYLTSVQWSRRLIGLKVFMSLAAAGRSGYAAQIEHDCRLGDRLRERLARDGWRIVNETPLPVVCFVLDDDHGGADHLTAIARHVVASGDAWISVAQLGGRPALRACITSHRSTEADVDALCELLAAARATSCSR
jgi:aromatic-L-amino-acid decarboxylase